ncbi:hypothetical protein [Lacinutrix sp. 5H-3-7-4]|uniref:hypothetical protein n=1 Tax=Lacinutrix sp. (strain 5H-3-7-4) TaxID=983544 RepID=UPI00020A32F4|nr:hypothetical protein [Lacinutrix sp. 5H-3-7-4]AEH02552.1 hypothetical protein Lacal_2712 [Lacinutrix sp. 5H-3-7-4]
MKTKNIFLLTLALFCSTSIICAQSVEKSLKIKKIIQASYSVKKTPETPRNSAFKGELLERYEVYDDNEKIIEYGIYDRRGNIYRVTKTQKDESGKQLKKTTCDSEGNLKQYYIYTLDDNGNEIELKNYNSKNKLFYLQKNKYDINGNVISKIGGIPESNKVSTTVLEYNSNNEMTQKIIYESYGSNTTQTYIYDSNGNEVISELFKSNGDYTKFISTYDERNNILTQYLYDKDEIQMQWYNWEYKYDKQGNWITKKEYSNGELSLVWERKIEY